MNRREFLLEMCRRADGSVDTDRFAGLCNRWSPQARAASLGVRFAKYGSGFAPAARAAAAAAAKARGGTVMAAGGRDGFIAAGGQAPGSELRTDTPPSKVMAPGGRDGFIQAGGQAPGGGEKVQTDLRRTPGDNKGFEPGVASGPAGRVSAGSSELMRGIRDPGREPRVPGPGAGALEGRQYRINGGLYYVKDGVLTKAYSDGGSQRKQGGPGGKFLPRETEGRETARNLEILRKAGVVLPDGSGGVPPDPKRRYMR